MPQGDKATRERIVEAADQLIYRQGYEQTSFADIAAEVDISRGNFYYHFRTKDEILQAVIAQRLAATRQMLADWEAECDTPAGRIGCYIDMMIANRALIKHYGCPVGTLSSELARSHHALAAEAGALFKLFRIWLRKQFAELGHKTEADALAMHLITRSQGIAALASVYHSERLIRREVALLHDWVRSLVQSGNGRRRRKPS